MEMYLGDSVYVDLVEDRITLTTENGFGPSNTIHLEWKVFLSLLDFVAASSPTALREHIISRLGGLNETPNPTT